MTPQLEALVTMLREQQASLLAELNERLHPHDSPDHLALSNQVGDSDAGVAGDVMNDINIAQLNSEVGALREVEAALERVAGGTYGLCTDCGEAIQAERLAVQPTAGHCLACQTLLEKKLGHAPHAFM